MSSFDPIPEIVKLGYTPREAAFLYFAGMHSGYFLRRQFNSFVGRDDGATSQRFCQKVVSLGHAETIDYGQKRCVFHLRSKLVYRLLNIEDSQSRRRKGDHEIKTRLMQLDFLLDHLGERILETEAQKVSFFVTKLNLPAAVLPQVCFCSDGSRLRRTRYFVERLPVLVRSESRTAAPRVSFGYIDNGTRTVKPFSRFLNTHARLLRSLASAEVIYVADSSRNFDEAERIFDSMFSPKLDKGGAQVSMFAASAHSAPPQNIGNVSLRGHLLEYEYPLWSPKYKGIAL